jgi:hypothetical protein
MSSAPDSDKPWCWNCRQHTEWRVITISTGEGTSTRRSCVICKKNMDTPSGALKKSNLYISISLWLLIALVGSLTYLLIDADFPNLGWSWGLILLMVLGIPGMTYLHGRAHKRRFHDNWREWAEKWEEGDAHNPNLKVHHEKQGKEDEEEKASCLLIFLGLLVIPLTCLWLFCASILDYERHGWHVVGGVVLLFAVYYIWNFIRGKK